MKKNSFFRTLLTILSTAFITFCITYIAFYAGTDKLNVGKTNTITTMYEDATNSKIQLIKNKIDDEYIGNVDENMLQEYTIKGYVAGLNDVYSEYYTVDEMKNYTNEVIGSYSGVGITMTKDTTQNQIVVYAVSQGSPAEEVGIKEGDIIIKVDGVDCTGDDFETIPDKIKGTEGTKVKITVLRNGTEMTFEVTRRRIVNQTVTSELLDGGIGYIHLASFENSSYEQFKTAYEDLVQKGAKSLIFDLRNNGGGIVDEAIDIGEMFTDKGQVLLIESSKNNGEDTTYAKQAKTVNMNVVVLVNENSASASEILASIFKDDVDNATIVGTTTFGKGVIQSLYTLTDGSGLKITTNEYFTPKHEVINKVGITPDVEVKGYNYAGTLDKANDTQLKKAIEILNSKK